MQNKIRILITGVGIWGNKGSRAMYLSLRNELRSYLPNYTIDYYLLSSRPKVEKGKYKEFGFSGIYEARDVKETFFDYLKYLFFGWPVFDNNEYFLGVKECDLVVDCSGISFHDTYKSFFDCLHNNINWWLNIVIPKILNKPVIKFTQSFGPNKFFVTCFLAKNALNKATLIIPRDKKSKESLLKLGVKKELEVCPDIAFNLKTIETEGVELYLKNKFDFSEENYKKIVGVCPNSCLEMYWDKEKYLDILVKLLDQVTESNPDYAIFILVNRDLVEGKPANADSDYRIAEEIISRIKRKRNVLFFNENMSVEMLKGVIGACDLFIGSRYHSLIFSLSMGVPSLALGWSHKYT